MSINSVTTDWWASPTTTDTGSTTGTNNLGDFDAFVKLLATQLQYQDPTDPVSSTEYVSQMAQMSTLQQLQTIGNSVNAYSAYGMIGKEVAYSTGENSAQIGTVDSVALQNGTIYLYVDGTKVPFDSILEVGSEAAESA